MIVIQGATEHNLQSIDATINDGLTGVSGVSGSGKTSLIFDTLYHEARRRFAEIYALGSSNLRLSPARVEQPVRPVPAPQPTLSAARPRPSANPRCDGWGAAPRSKRQLPARLRPHTAMSERIFRAARRLESVWRHPPARSTRRAGPEAGPPPHVRADRPEGRNRKNDRRPRPRSCNP